MRPCSSIRETVTIRHWWLESQARANLPSAATCRWEQLRWGGAHRPQSILPALRELVFFAACIAGNYLAVFHSDDFQ